MLVEVKNLVKRYGNILAVDNVNLSIAEGEIFGLLGPNGAGKTTTMNMLVGLTNPDSGEINLLGYGKNGQARKHIGVVPQEIAVYEDLTAAENVSLFGKLYGLGGSQLKERVKEALAFTGLEERAKQFPKKFSGGMKRRLNIACALVHRPKLIIMDEPTVGIDPQSRKHILDSVRFLHSQGTTVIYTSHYMEEVEELCTRIAIMDQGRVIARGTKEELKELVSADDRIVLELASVNFTIINTLKQLSGVKECSLADNTLSVLTEKNSGIISRVIDVVTEAGGQVLSLNVERPTLESVFLTLTGRTLRD